MYANNIFDVIIVIIALIYVHSNNYISIVLEVSYVSNYYLQLMTLYSCHFLQNDVG